MGPGVAALAHGGAQPVSLRYEGGGLLFDTPKFSGTHLTVELPGG